MSVQISGLQFKTLRRSANSDEYKLYRAALEWDLTEPIVIENRKDLKSEQQWRDRVEPYYHQVTNLITFCRRLPVTLLADDVGLGKTISAGLVASELISRGRVSKILIVCPKLLLPQWREELDVKFGIPAIEAVGRELTTVKPPEEAGAIITTYHSARLHFKAIAKAGFDMLILDEAHKLRNLYGVERPPQVAIRFRQALADRLFKYVLMLTATPIQNRLWDLYSLVDLLTVARGHENPFGSEGMFARTFIKDNRSQARQLKPEKRDEFRSIVYGYMSRVRRADAKLHFPDRKVQLHKVEPTQGEIELINVIAGPIQQLNRLAQISILQALTSSPHALAAQLENMANRGSVPSSLAVEVRTIVERMQTTAKLQGLGSLVAQLKTEQPDRWRMVVFTGRRETQTTIEAFLEEQGIRCGLINGDSGSRNQQTIAKFKKDPPEIHVIVSTEAGSEGVNLQAANVLINYDLPWNPMIVEQRIGRIQRLASAHETVCIFNVILKGTFEEYIVGRLMEKLQMASHAIGDVEALLEAAGLDEDEDDTKGFAEKIRELVVASLAGKNVEQATRLAEQSIIEAKTELDREEKNINSMLGGTDGAIDLGPRCPKLPPHERSMDLRSFVIAALRSMGANLSEEASGIYVVELEGKHETIRFEESEIASENYGTLCRPGSGFFERLVSRIANQGLHQVEDIDRNPASQAQEIAKNWVNSFNAHFESFRIEEIQRCFAGVAILRVRATVAHDSYERLIEVPCSSEGPFSNNVSALEPIGKSLENLSSLGLPTELLTSKAMEDTAIDDFCRFYQERLADEIKAAGEDAQKRKKLEDDFTPRIEIVLVGLAGKLHRQLKLRVSYKVGKEMASFESALVINPSATKTLSQPAIATCELSGATVPQDCLGRCEISGKLVMHSMLTRSEQSGRMALPTYIVICALSGKRALSDEVEKSAATGKEITKSLLKTSAVSGKKAEPEFFSRCDFTGAEVLKAELAISQISGKQYRVDEQTRSVVSGKSGHRLEFVICSETKQPLLQGEAERCEVTGKLVVPGLLERCEISGKKVLPFELEKCGITGKKALKSFFISCSETKQRLLSEIAEKCESTGKVVIPGLLEKCAVSGMRVLPSELEKSEVTGKKALKKYFVNSSLSGVRLLEQEAVRSSTGKFCVANEAKVCLWDGGKYHPDDIRICELTNTTLHFEKLGRNGKNRFHVLSQLLEGSLKMKDNHELWDDIESKSSRQIGARNSKVESTVLSPDGQHIAASLEVRNWLGMNPRHAGCLFNIKNNAVVGRVVVGKRNTDGWLTEEEQNLKKSKAVKICPKCKEKNNPGFTICWKCKTKLGD